MRFLLIAVAFAGCGPAFEKALTPSGGPCSDMPILPAGQSPDRPYHRIGTVKSRFDCTTDPERLESLRRAACKIGADAVIEASNAEVRQPNNDYVTQASGYAIVWNRAPQRPRPIGQAPTPTTLPPAPPPPAPDGGAR